MNTRGSEGKREEGLVRSSAIYLMKSIFCVAKEGRLRKKRGARSWSEIICFIPDKISICKMSEGRIKEGLGLRVRSSAIYLMKSIFCVAKDGRRKNKRGTRSWSEFICSLPGDSVFV